MAQKNIPTEITLSQKDKSLRVSFENEKSFNLPCEYLRVYSPSAENKVSREMGDWVKDKEEVNITKIEPIGTYAIRLYFDDSHSTGVYSWDTLFELGQNHEKNWSVYQQYLETGSIPD